MNFKSGVEQLISSHKKVFVNPSREMLIHKSVTKEKVFVTKTGALSVWTPAESTGRSPKDTFIVKNSKTEKTVDWTSPNNLPVTQETFDMLFEDAVAALSKKDSLFVTDRVIGADASYALPIRTITDRAFTSLFADNMFRAIPEGIEKSVLFDKKFTLLVVPYDKLDEKKYRNRIRMINENKSSNMAIVMDFENSLGIVFGSAYLGSCKKLMFTVMNYYLPECGILPLHCSANEGADGVSALMLGLSGTGKTTLSADPARKLIGDDEHGWNDTGIANFENGCYAKLINLNKEKEPEIYNAVFHEADYMEHGAMIENCMIYPDGTIDFDDERYTANSRASYPLRFLSNIKESSVSSHPSTIIFLTADANGVLPPVAKLTKEQAMLWFLMGYTSKLA
ncbi:phosphoenolpyruvate carboxykinase (ATP), partial [bacterium]|nr:phosphoenolpyruvate carboxykinase (ATP) [bacterium]